LALFAQATVKARRSFLPLSLPKSRFERTDDVARQGSGAQQGLRNARSSVCTAHPSQAKHAFAPRYEGHSIYAPPTPIYEGRSAFAPADPVTIALYGHRGGSCFVTTSPIESVKGIRHWRPVC
jgi:hypothetical protein